MGALDTLIDQIRRSNISDISEQLESGDISPQQVPQKLADATGDPQYLQMAREQQANMAALKNITPDMDQSTQLATFAQGLTQQGDPRGITMLSQLPKILADLQKTRAETSAANSTAAKNNWDMGIAPTGATTSGVATVAPAAGDKTVTSAITANGLTGKGAQDVAVKAAQEKATETIAAEKGVQQILSRLPSMKQKLNEMNDLAPNTMSGMGVVPAPDSNESTGFKGQLMNQFDSDNPKIGNTAAFKNLNDQLFVNEIPALMNGASGMRMDIPLVKGVKSASGVPIELPSAAKQQVIGTLNENFDQTRDNALSYYKNLTGQDYDLGKAFQTPEEIANAVKQKVITRDQAIGLLKKNHGAQ